VSPATTIPEKWIDFSAERPGSALTKAECYRRLLKRVEVGFSV
jgi:hypothetical protein